MKATTKHRRKRSNEVTSNQTLNIFPGVELDEIDAQALYIPALRRFIHESFSGKRSVKDLRAVHALLLPKQSPHVERAMEIYKLMQELSRVVDSSRPDSISLFGGTISTLLTGAIKLSTDESAKHLPIYSLAKKYWRPRATLKSLAIRVFLETLPRSKRFEGMDKRSIERDLQKLGDLIAENRSTPVEIALSSGETLPYFFSTELWKVSKD